MQTYTHWVITAAIKRRWPELGQTQGFPTLSEAQWTPLIGSVAPDLPLILIAAGCALYDRIAQREASPDHPPNSMVGHLFSHMFFHNPAVKAFHHIFHAPILTLTYTGIGYLAWRRGRAWGSKLFWFGLSTTLHTTIDIPLHHNDGPLIFFPFDWHTRYYSPVSYWDPKHHGRSFFIFEHVLLISLIIYLIFSRKKTPKSQL